MSTHRLFFALRPDDATVARICAVQDRIDDHLDCRRARRVPASRLHITALFLGNQGPDQLRVLDELAPTIEFEPCMLQLDHIGHFPRSAVIWLGGHAVPAELRDFQGSLSAKVASVGIGFDERPWKPHLTLYRDLRKRPATIHFEPIDWPVTDFVLMESVQDRRGLRYECRGRWPRSAAKPGAD